MTDSIDYGHLMHNAMRGLIKAVLEGVKADGLPGDHHFFITFDTTHPDVELAPWLRERYPADMTVVMQHWYDALEVRDDGFSITLNFGDAPEALSIPFDALRTFVDPSVEFGLRFETNTDEDTPVLATVTEDSDDFPGLEDTDITAETLVPTPEGQTAKSKSDTPKSGKPEAEIVSLDSFRK